MLKNDRIVATTISPATSHFVYLLCVRSVGVAFSDCCELCEGFAGRSRVYEAWQMDESAVVMFAVVGDRLQAVCGWRLFVGATGGDA